jgi:hypothetical protein
MLRGGSLIPDKTFKKIISIGYEFESHDLAKLSLHKNKKYLINSNVSLRVLADKLKENRIEEIDETYLSIRIPIHKNETPPKKDKSVEDETEMEELSEEDRLLMEEFADEFEEVEEEEKLKQLEVHENESYLEYFNENRKTDNKANIKFQITNDIGDVDFGFMLKEYCEPVNLPKNDMYFFKTNTGKLYDIKFSEEITNSCPTFTGIEYVITYYNPQRENASIIIETFVDACSRIVDHLGNLKSIDGTLVIQDTKKTHYTPIGQLEGNRKLYHKPDTNLYYLDTSDTFNTKNPNSLGDTIFVPQMTFKCKTIDLIDIMKEILEIEDFKKGQHAIQDHDQDLEDLEYLEKMVDALLENFNKKTKLGQDRKRRTIDITSDMGKILKTYMLLLFYKVFYYIQEHKVILDKDEDDYLKDHLSFASRHNNLSLYLRCKEILRDHFDITDLADIHRLFWEPSIVVFLYKFTDPKKKDRSYEGSAKADLPISDKHYGDPLYSLSSYFRHFETPKLKNLPYDWLMANKIDAFSSTFELKNDEILVENRFFRFEIGLWLRNTVEPKLSKDTLKLNEMAFIVNRLYGKNIKKMMNLEKNPFKNRLTRRCPPGYYRTPNFNCMKQKSRKTVKRKTAKLPSKSQKEPLAIMKEPSGHKLRSSSKKSMQL